MSRTKYQRIVVKMQLPNVAVQIDAETDKLFKKAKEVTVYSGSSYSTNRNLSFSKPLKINGNEIYPDGFDTFLLFPRMENKDYMCIEEIAAGSKVEGEIVDKNSFATPYDVTILLTLVSE